MKIKLTAIAAAIAIALTGCTDADVASQNLSKDADNFKIVRRVVFFNGITDKYLLTIEGRCSIVDESSGETPGGSAQLEVTCKIDQNGKTEYKKHFLGLSDNVSYFVEQMDGADVPIDHYKVVLKPSVVAPELEINEVDQHHR